LTEGAQELGKEHIEIHFDQKSIIISNFKNINCYGMKYNERKFPTIQKGHLEELEQFSNAFKINKNDTFNPISLESLIETTNVTFNIREALINS
jgi:hypothetical protein